MGISVRQNPSFSVMNIRVRQNPVDARSDCQIQTDRFGNPNNESAGPGLAENFYPFENNEIIGILCLSVYILSRNDFAIVLIDLQSCFASRKKCKLFFSF